MSRAPLRSFVGTLIGEVALEPALFDAQVNVPVMHQVVVAQMAARRAGTHATKTRGEVSGGGRKPWRQKGTGRARQGSIRAPHWAGGGVVWGPRPRDHSVKVPRKMRQIALSSALSDRAKEGRIVVFESLEIERPRTKDAVGLLGSSEMTGTVLLVLEERNDVVWKSFRNIAQVHVITVDQLNTYDILARDWLAFTKPAIDRLNARGAGAPGGEAP